MRKQPDPAASSSSSPKPKRAPAVKAPAPWTPRKLVTWLLADLKASEFNAKKHPAAQLERLEASIRAYGFTAPILVRSGGEIIAGHARAEAARRAGLKRVPVIVLDHLTEDQARALRIADNRISELGEWDVSKLGAELEDLIAAGADLSALGWTDAEMGDLVAQAASMIGDLPDLDGSRAAPASAPAAIAPASSSTDAADGQASSDTEGEPAPRWQALLKGRAPVVSTGELWTVGGHRLVVGDACDVAAVALVMEGEDVETVITDPPYCSGGNQEAGRSAGTWGKIAADNLSSDGYAALMRKWITAARPNTVYAFTDWRQWNRLGNELETSGLPVRGMIVWDKMTPAHGAMWRAQHELVAYASRAGNRREPGRDSGGNVIRCGRSGNRNHYTEKPLALLEKLAGGDAMAGRVGPILDPFAGSGSTLLAAHRVGRVGRGIEIEPAFAQIALLRLSDEVGAPAIRVADGANLVDLLEAQIRAEGAAS